MLINNTGPRVLLDLARVLTLGTDSLSFNWTGVVQGVGEVHFKSSADRPTAYDLGALRNLSCHFRLP